MSEPVAIGVDLGGTMVRVGAVTASGEIRAQSQHPIQAEQGPGRGLETINALIGEVMEESGARLMGVGISSTGPLDLEKGAIQNPYTLPTWEDVPIVSYLQERFQVRVNLENDGDAAALGEYWLGAGRGVGRLYAVTVGTGIGCAYILDGQVQRGLGRFHPEGGHQVLDPNGPLCYCGSHGCWESLASGSAIARQAREALAGGRKSAMRDMAGGDFERLDAKTVTDAARAGDPLAVETIERAAYYTGVGLVNIAMMFMPEAVVLSGGVMKSAELFFPQINQALHSISDYVPTGKMRVTLAELGYFAGLYGAAYTIIKGLENG